MAASLALSTAYFTLRSPLPSGNAMLTEALALGFGALEVEYRVDPDQARPIAAAVARGEVVVDSVHHPFPRPPEVDPRRAHVVAPRCSSLDPGERRAAVEQARTTLARAADLGARVVVLHLGAVDLPAGVDSRALERCVRAEEDADPAAAELRETLMGARRRAAAPHLEVVLGSLDRLAGAALRCGIQLGLENRYHAEEIPDGEELQRIFQELAGAPLGYWHDVGHGASQEAQGLLADQVHLLERFRDQLLGFHLHDVRGLEDHLAPGEGDLEFSRFAPYLGPDILRVLEVQPPACPQAVAASPELLRRAGLAI